MWEPRAISTQGFHRECLSLSLFLPNMRTKWMKNKAGIVSAFQRRVVCPCEILCSSLRQEEEEEEGEVMASLCAAAKNLRPTTISRTWEQILFYFLFIFFFFKFTHVRN